MPSVLRSVAPAMRSAIALRRNRVAALVAVGVLCALGAVGMSGCARPEAARQAQNLGTRLCFTNQTNRPIEILIDRADTSTGTGQVTAGGQACAEGTFASDFDVQGSMLVASDSGNSLKLYFGARNPWMGAPRFGIYSLRGASIAQSICTGSGWDVGESHTMSDSGISIDVKRLADDNWKEFTAVVRGDLAESLSPAVFRTASFTVAQRMPTASWLAGC